MLFISSRSGFFRIALVLMTMLSLVFSQMDGAEIAEAASHTTTLSFSSNVAGGSATSTVPNLTTVSNGTVILGPNPGSVTENFSGVNGTDYHLNTAISTALVQSGALSVVQSTTTYLYTTSGTTWTVPVYWNSASSTIEAIGPGGNGIGNYGGGNISGTTQQGGGDGGAGGGFGEVNAPAHVLPGDTVTFQVGTGGSQNVTYLKDDTGAIIVQGGYPTCTWNWTGNNGWLCMVSETNIGTITYMGGPSGNGAGGGTSYYGGGGGGGAAGPNGPGAAGTASDAQSGGAGAGADGGYSGYGGNPGYGGANSLGTGGGVVTGATGGSGTPVAGVGGAGGAPGNGYSSVGLPVGGNGANGEEWDANHGAGGGGGGGGANCAGNGGGSGGNGGQYGGGGGGAAQSCGGPSGQGGTGGDGLLVLTTHNTTGTGISTAVATSSFGFTNATIANSTVDNAGTGSITYYLSNDGGTTWTQATKGTAVTFSNTSQGTLMYKAVLTGNATISSITISYLATGYAPSGTLSHIVADASAQAAWPTIYWNATLPAGTGLEFRTRGSNISVADLANQSWSGYITATSTGTSSAQVWANGSSTSTNPVYQYLEVQATLTTTAGNVTPTLNSVGLVYSQNVAPVFDTTAFSGSGSKALQDATSSDAAWGKVQIQYAVLDPDTSSGTVNPGCIQPSFSYRLNPSSAWTSIPSSDINLGSSSSCTDLNGNPHAGYQIVSDTATSTYTATWNVDATIPNAYSTTAQVMVQADDHEAVYNIGTSTTPTFTIDTTPPSISSLKIDGSSASSTLSLSASDNSNMAEYDLSNNSDGSYDGNNDSSGYWEMLSATSSATSTPSTPGTVTYATTSPSSLGINTSWNLTGSTTASVTAVVKDIYGNTATSTAVAPVDPADFELHDLSNQTAGYYKLFVAWTPYGATSTAATFSKYELYRSTDGTNYSLFQSITDPSTNYYIDNSVASTTTYYYKLRTIDTDGDSSAFTSVVHAKPLGLGGSSLPPIISGVATSNVKNTSAEVTWTTNTLSNSLVTYGTMSNGSCGYGSSASSASYVTSHAVYLTNLQPNTTYCYKVTSTDYYNNVAADDNAGASYTFTTNGGPIITNVTVNALSDKAATIFWNTDRSADSQVYYATNSNMTGASQVGDATLVATTTSSGVYSHSVTLSGLSAATTYYFYVTSTDGSGNTTKSDNNGQNYSFLTTRDTTPPVVSNISTPVVSDTNAVVVWETDKLASSQVEYGTVASTTDGSYSDTTALDGTLTTYHVATLTGLTANTPYYFRVISSDAAGNRAYSPENTFTTAQPGNAKIVYISSGGGSGSNTVVDKTPPTINSVTIDKVDAFDATVEVTGSPEFYAVVQYGAVSTSTPNSPYTNTAGDATLSTTKSIELTNLMPGTTYHLIVTAIKGNGMTAQSSVTTFTTKYLAEDLSNLTTLQNASDLQGKLQDLIQSALPSLLPPFMSTPTVSSTTESSATVSWSTNIPAYTVLDYASDDEYQKGNQTYAHEISDIQVSTTTHTVEIPNLSPSTKYHFSTHSFIFPQVVAKSPDYTFTTKSAPVSPQIINVQTDSFAVGWTTDIKTTSVVEYTDTASGTVQTIKDTSLSTQHFVSVQNLQPGHTYSVKVYGIDSGGNTVSAQAPLTVTTLVDHTKPKITALRIDSNLVPGRTDIIQSIVSWTTDKPSTSAVYFEEGAGAATQPLQNKVVNDTGYVQNHVVILPNLKPSTTYRIQVSSTDQAGNTLLLPVRTFVTPQQSESIIDIIFKNFSDTFNFVH